MKQEETHSTGFVSISVWHRGLYTRDPLKKKMQPAMKNFYSIILPTRREQQDRMGVHAWFKFLKITNDQVPWCTWPFSKLSSVGGRYESKILTTSMKCCMSHPCVSKHSTPGTCETLRYMYLSYGSTREISTLAEIFQLISIKLQRFRWSSKAESSTVFLSSLELKGVGSGHEQQKTIIGGLDSQGWSLLCCDFWDLLFF